MSSKYILSFFAILFSLFIGTNFVTTANAMEGESRPCASGKDVSCLCSSTDNSMMSLHVAYQNLTLAVQKKDMPSVKQYAKEIENTVASMKDTKTKKHFEKIHKYAKELAVAKTEKEVEKLYSELNKSFATICSTCGCGAMKKGM